MEELFSTIYRSVKKSSLHQTEPELTMLLEESAAHFLPQGVEVESGTESHRNAFETSEPDQLQVLNDESRSSTQAPSPAHQDVIFGYRGPSQEADGAAADPSIERGDTQCISPGGLDPRYTNSNMYSQSPRTDYLVTGQGPLKTTQLNTTNFSYSFREASFSRRLHRYCLEGAYRLFIDPASDPTTVYRVFRLVHCIVDKIKMRPYFEALLRRGSGESLEISSLPFYCVGRAGTHYPMKDKSGKPTHPQNMRLSKRVLGSLPPPVTEGPDQDQRYQEFLDMMGYGGVWFDSHDVEAYLAEKGIFPESHSSHVDIQQAPSGSHLNTSSASTAALGYQTPNVADGVRGSAMAQEIHPTNGSKNLQSLLSSNAYPDLQNIAPLTQPAPTCYSTAHVCIDVTAHRSVSKKPSLFFDVQCFLDCKQIISQSVLGHPCRDLWLWLRASLTGF
jgi:hypothetical protein